MTDLRKDAGNIAMKGGGYYSLATKGAKDVIDGAATLVLAAVDAIAPGEESRPFTLADMGCADGGTSLSMIAQALAALRQKLPSRPLAVVYSDQPNNDYNALFATLHGTAATNSYLASIDNVFTFASANSFYQAILPPGHLDLGFSATAMHWLSAKPTNLSDHIHATGATGAEAEAFATQGRKDWQTILLHRAKELAPGGRLVLVNFCRDEEGRYLGNTTGIHMFDTMNQIWLDLLSDGAITAPEYEAMTLPQYYKSVEEFSEPLLDTRNPVYQAGLRQVSIETRIVPCPYAEDFRRHGDAAHFAKDYIPTIRSWNESTFFAALSQERPIEERRALINRYYGTYEEKVRDAPDGHGMDYVHAYQVIEKL